MLDERGKISYSPETLWLNKLEGTFQSLGEGVFTEVKRVEDIDYYGVRLPPDAIPTLPKEEEAKERKIELGVVVEVLDKGVVIPLHGAIADKVKEEVRRIRRRDLRGKALQDEYARIRWEFLTLAIKYFPEEKKKLLDGVWQLRFFTISRKPEKPSERKEAQVEGDDSDIAKMAEMVDLSDLDWEKLLSGDILPKLISELDINLPQEGERGGRGREGEARPVRLPNDLEMLRLKMGKAMSSGKREDWEEIADDYIRYMDYLPQYIEHRIAIIDLFRRYQEGEIRELPQYILSVASGPYEEARAQMDFAFLYEELGLKRPQIYNLDFSLGILKKGEDAYIDKAIRNEVSDIDVPFNIIGDMRALPIKGQTFDMVECSSLDNLMKKSSVDLEASLKEMAGALKPDGLLRISHKERLPEEFYDFLESQGLRFITPPHTTYALPQEVFQKVEAEWGVTLAQRLKRKVGRHAQYILAVKEGKNFFMPNQDIQEAIDGLSLKEQGDEAKRLRELQDEIERIVAFFEEHPEKGKASVLRKALMNDIADSLELDVYNGILLKEGKVIDPPKEVSHRVIELKHLQGGIPQRVLLLSGLDRKYRIELLKRYAPQVYRKLEILEVV